MDNIGRYYGLYRGVVKNNRDPMNKRRVKVAVPQTTGDKVTNWAWPVDSGNVHYQTPPVGQGVWVMYQGGDPDYPVWVSSFGKSGAKSKQPYFSGIPDSENISDVTDLLTIINNQDGTYDYDFSNTLLNVVRNRYYGVFLNTTTQTTGSNTEERKVNLNETVEANGITNSGGTLTIAHAGVYSITFSMQLTNLDSQAHEAKVWAKLNGTNVANSASVITVPGTHGGIKGHTILTVNFVIGVNGNSTLELWGGANDVNVRLESLSSSDVVNIGPASPAVILTVTKVR